MTEEGPRHPFQAIHADAWQYPLDLPSLNKDASDLILARIAQVSRIDGRDSAQLRAASVLLLGPAGSGKTHLFTRLRAQAGARAIFVHTRPEIAAEPSPRHVLAAVVDALRQPVLNGGDYRQIDVLAGTMLAALAGRAPRRPLMLLEDHRDEPAPARRALIERVVARAEDQFPEISATYLERLLAVPFADRKDQRALFAWLSGREPSEIELARVGAPGALGDLEVLPALKALGVSASFGAPLVLVFDQLENLAEESGKVGRILAHARLVSELRDRMHGLVIVQMALDAEWMSRIHPVLHASDRDRLEEAVKTLSLPTAEERLSLLQRWRDELPAPLRARPFPSPFSAADISAWTERPGMTPRMLMQACGEAYERAVAAREPATPADPDERLSLAWERSMARARGEIDDAADQGRGVSAERLLGGLLGALCLLGVEVTGAALKDVPSLKVMRAGRALIAIVAQHAHHRSLAAAIRAAAASAASGTTLILREQAFAIPPTWREVDKLLADLTAARGVAFAPIERADVVRLLALEHFLAAARSQDLSADDGRPIPEDAARAWALSRLDCAAWGPLKGILAEEPSVPTPSPPISRERGSGTVLHLRPPVEPVDRAMSPVRTALEQLRVTSIDRLTREARAIDPTTTRATVTEELSRLPIKVFGSAVVALMEPRP